MEPLEPQDTCRPVEVDGETIRVHGAGEMTDEDRGHFATIVRAVKARMAHDQAMEVIRDIAVGDTTPSDLEAALLSIGWVHTGEDTALVANLLADPHRHDHILDLAAHGWTVQHPLAERLEHDLFDCPLNAHGEHYGDMWTAGGPSQWRIWLDDGGRVQTALLP